MGKGREARGEGSEEKNRLALTSGTGISIVEILQCSSSPTTNILMPQEHTSTRGTQQGPLYLPWLVIWCAMAWAVTLFPTPASFAAERVTDTNTASSRIGQSHPTLVEAKRLIESQQAEAAIARLKKFITSTDRPSHLAEAYLLLGSALMSTDKFEHAATYLERLLNDFPESDLGDRARLLLASVYSDTGKLDQALPLLSEVRSLASDTQTLHAGLNGIPYFLLRRRPSPRILP